jgi:hypothetical protein
MSPHATDAPLEATPESVCAPNQPPNSSEYLNTYSWYLLNSVVLIAGAALSEGNHLIVPDQFNAHAEPEAGVFTVTVKLFDSPEEGAEGIATVEVCPEVRVNSCTLPLVRLIVVVPELIAAAYLFSV